MFQVWMPNTTAIQASFLSEKTAWNEDYNCSPAEPKPSVIISTWSIW